MIAAGALGQQISPVGEQGKPSRSTAARIVPSVTLPRPCRLASMVAVRHHGQAEPSAGVRPGRHAAVESGQPDQADGSGFQEQSTAQRVRRAWKAPAGSW
jgi:hypothetical protein